MTEPWTPDWTVHPGVTLAETLAERKMTQREFARRTGLSAKHINLIINGKSGYSADVAMSFERVLGVPALFWLRLLAQYQDALLRGAKDLK